MTVPQPLYPNFIFCQLWEAQVRRYSAYQLAPSLESEGEIYKANNLSSRGPG